jgi:1-deoxy-D-xylulose-5-phosphate reductoisomerase
MSRVCRVIVLGSTGSIGTQTLEVIEHLNELHARGEAESIQYEVVGLAAGKNELLLKQQAAGFRVQHTTLAAEIDDSEVGSFRESCTGPGVEWSHGRGDDAVVDMVGETECDLVVAAISGIAGLAATWAAVERGRDVALANKETLVAAGSLIVPMARRTGSRLFPVDSEHSGVWQCIEGRHEGTEARRHEGQAPPMDVGDVARVILTASGGPFRTWTRERIRDATVEQALKHPTWSMGKKVTIDSASLMNKALEIVEAHWLFGLPADRIAAVIHPQSIVHAMVEFVDGSVVAQLGAPDMKTPIQHALTWPRRAIGCSKKINWAELGKLEFEEVDGERYPAMGLAYRVIRESGNSGAVMNAANEAAVTAFLAGRIGFGRIAELTERAMDSVAVHPVKSLEDVLDADREARECVERLIA